MHIIIQLTGGSKQNTKLRAAGGSLAYVNNEKNGSKAVKINIKEAFTVDYKIKR